MQLIFKIANMLSPAIICYFDFKTLKITYMKWLERYWRCIDSLLGI